MTMKYSFSGIEKDLLHEFRDKISKSEDSLDVSNVFSRTAKSFLFEVFKDKISVQDTDCIFDPDKDESFQFSEKIMAEQDFLDTLGNSDMKNVIARFADTAKHRYLHLKKNPKHTVVK